ncbi:MAG: AEC family transporter [Erysipelotrichaceae bacterium]
MDITNTLITQLLIMALLIAMGFVATKKKWLDLGGTRQLGSILLNIVTPIIIINSLLKTYNHQEFQSFALIILVAVAWNVLYILLAKLFFKSDQVIEQASVVFTNLSFFGIPIVSAVLGKEAVFYLIGPIIVYWLFMFTYGEILLTQRKSISIKRLFLNPAVIATALGLTIYFSGFQLPSVILGAMGGIASLNTPVAMLIMGCYLAHIDLSYFKLALVWKVCFIRLIVLPLIVILVLVFVPIDFALKYIVLICVSSPVGNTVAIFAQQFNLDYRYSAAIISVSSLLVMLTLPIMSLIGTNLW